LHADAYHQFLPFVLPVAMLCLSNSAKKSKAFIVNPPLPEINRDRVDSLMPVY